LPKNASTTIRSRGAPVPASAASASAVDELQLVEEVVLEPEDDVAAVGERSQELRVAALERGEDRLPASPTALRKECRARLQQLPPRSRRDRPLVEDVLPRQHGTAEPSLPQRVARTLAVGDMEQRGTRRGLASATREVRRTAGAMVERVAGAADDARQLVTHPSQAGDA
jgi:hypothetical protein